MTTNKRPSETPDERKKRRADNVERDRARLQAADAAVDRMISENVKRHGA